MVLVHLVALVLAHCIVCVVAPIPVAPMATACVVIHWGPGYAGGGKRVWLPRGWMSCQGGVDAWSGRTGSVQVLESCVLWKGPAAANVHDYKSNLFSPLAGCCVHRLPSGVPALVAGGCLECGWNVESWDALATMPGGGMAMCCY